jgi:hypothetical protein
MESAKALRFGKTYVPIVNGMEKRYRKNADWKVMKNHRTWMVTIYLFLMAGFLYLKPTIAFGREGRVRPFGTSDKEATVFPLWWWIFVISVVAYCTTIYLAGYRLG